MTDSRRPWILVAIVAVVVVAAIGGWLLFRPTGEEPLEVADPSGLEKPTDGVSEGADPEYVMVGGVRRKRSDIEQPPQEETSEEDDDSRPSPFNYGTMSPVKPDANPQVASVAEALQTKKHPERLSTLIRPAAFNAEAFENDPEKYLSTVEPGRVFQSAQPGPDVLRLRRQSPLMQHVTQGDSVPIAVKAKPGDPVTFTSFDGGAFGNQLTSITVQADADGRAEVNFLATPGVIAEVKILSASPNCSGVQKFIIDVRLPETQ